MNVITVDVVDGQALEMSRNELIYKTHSDRSEHFVFGGCRSGNSEECKSCIGC